MCQSEAMFTTDTAMQILIKIEICSSLVNDSRPLLTSLAPRTPYAALLDTDRCPGYM